MSGPGFCRVRVFYGSESESESESESGPGFVVCRFNQMFLWCKETLDFFINYVIQISFDSIKDLFHF